MDKKLQINLQRVPKHVAIIMDGNGRWAKSKGMSRIFGHRNALTAVREAVKAASQINIEAITLYAFSTENWNRPKLEVDALMRRKNKRYWRYRKSSEKSTKRFKRCYFSNKNQH
jgi:undecaprenyl diphosphate synthase